MTSPSDHLGLVDYAVIEFPGSQFNGEVAPAIVDLVASGTIRLLDLAVILKSPDGDVSIVELADVSESDPLLALTEFIIEVIAEEDILSIAEVLEPGSAAILVVWENLWALELAHAIRGSGGQMVASGRIPAEEIAATLAEAAAAE